MQSSQLSLHKERRRPRISRKCFNRFKKNCPHFAPERFKGKGFMTLISEQAKEYEELVRSHVTANFKPKTIQYLLMRASDVTDAFYIKNTTTSERRAIVSYAYEKSTASKDTFSVPAIVSKLEKEQQNVVNAIVNALKAQMGPLPISDVELNAKPHLHMKWIHTILQRLERQVSIRDHQPQNYVSWAFIHRNVHEMVLKKISFSKPLFRSLKAAVRNAITSEGTLTLAKKFTTPLPSEIYVDEYSVVLLCESWRAYGMKNDIYYVPTDHSNHRSYATRILSLIVLSKQNFAIHLAIKSTRVTRDTHHVLSAPLPLPILPTSTLYDAFAREAFQLETIHRTQNYQPLLPTQGKRSKPRHEKYTDPRGARRFTIFPVYSFQPRHVTLDNQSFTKTLVQAGIRTAKDGQLNQANVRQEYFNVFDMQKIGLPTVESLQTEKILFWDRIRTDGYDVQFIFKKPKNDKQDPLTPSRFQRLLAKDPVIWGVDPGINQTFVAADGGVEDQHHIRKLSSKEYYDVCSYNKQPKPAQSIPSKIRSRICTFFDHEFRFNKLKFKTYINRQKATTEIVKFLIGSSKKYHQLHRCLQLRKSLRNVPLYFF
ncbi:hypothetical protein VTP01DRAFT_9054 [Rhizomucor pusillus]|uniref:uncharacterized protein n=1 Tax=Rhizomucor pusillus TaxID=4840 RepID=UPI003743DB71